MNVDSAREFADALSYGFRIHLGRDCAPRLSELREMRRRLGMSATRIEVFVPPELEPDVFDLPGFVPAQKFSARYLDEVSDFGDVIGACEMFVFTAEKR